MSVSVINGTSNEGAYTSSEDPLFGSLNLRLIRILQQDSCNFESVGPGPMEGIILAQN